MKTYSQILFLLLVTLFVACEKDDPVIVNEEELITTVSYTLVPQSGGPEVVLSFKDLDGDGGNAPEIQGGTLISGEIYEGSLSLLNESVSPADNVTAEIAEEDVDHQFFFESSIQDITISYNDSDPNGNPIGLRTNVLTRSAGAGSLTITLRHQPNKSATGVSQGLIEQAGGETDIEVTFPINVE